MNTVIMIPAQIAKTGWVQVELTDDEEDCLDVAFAMKYGSEYFGDWRDNPCQLTEAEINGLKQEFNLD